MELNKYRFGKILDRYRNLYVVVDRKWLNRKFRLFLVEIKFLLNFNFKSKEFAMEKIWNLEYQSSRSYYRLKNYKYLSLWQFEVYAIGNFIVILFFEFWMRFLDGKILKKIVTGIFT